MTESRTPPKTIDDVQWLAALTGDPDPQATPKINQEAATIRRVITAQVSARPHPTPSSEEASYQQLLFKLTRERIPDDHSSGENQAYSSPKGAEGSSKSKSIPRRRRQWYQLGREPKRIAIAAALALGLGLATMHMNHQVAEKIRVGSDLLVRGAHVAVQIVKSPEERLIELQKGLSARGGTAEIERLPSGNIRLSIMPNEETLAYLRAERFMPTVKDGRVLLELEAAHRDQSEK